jgi:hypothetical protein
MNQDPLTSEVIEAIKKFKPILIKAREIRNSLVDETEWDLKSDVRINVFEQIDNLIRSLNLSSAVSVRGFLDKEWIKYQLFRNKDLSKKEKIQNLHAARTNLHSFHRMSFTYCLTQVVEGAVRSIAREIIPNENGNGKLGPLCKKLSKHLKNPTKINSEMRNALDLLREIRNTIHNNGFYFGHKSKDGSFTINYRGKKYTFYNSKPHNFATYSLLAQITDDITDLIRTIVFDPKVYQLESLTGTTGNVFERINA